MVYPLVESNLKGKCEIAFKQQKAAQEERGGMWKK